MAGQFVDHTTTVIVLAPWIVRNYRVLDEFVPVRNGLGYQLYLGNPALTRTFTPTRDTDNNGSQPPWTVSTPYQSLELLGDLKSNTMLHLQITPERS